MTAEEQLFEMSLYAFYDLLKARRFPKLTSQHVKEIQRKKLRKIVKHAYENVLFYHRKFDNAGVNPDDIKSVEDLVKVPTTNKFEVQASPFDAIVAKNIELSKCTKRTTSGSTGIPLVTVFDSKAIAQDGAHWTRAYLENKLKFRDKTVFITHPHNFQQKPGIHERLGLMRRMYISIFDNPEKQLALLEKYKPDALQGYPSSIAILSDIMRRNNCFRPRVVFTTSELLDTKARETIREAFGVEATDLYGCIELGLMAWQCEKHESYHIDSDNVVMEFLSTNEEKVSPGETGEIVCTGLNNYSMPLIRYKIGDVGAYSDEQCPCGRGLPLLKIIEGRADDLLVSPDGRILSPRVFFPDPFGGVQGIRQFKVIQERKNMLKVLLVVDQKFSLSQVIEKGKGRIQEFFGSAMQVEFQVVDEILRDPSGKIRKIVSMISPDY